MMQRVDGISVSSCRLPFHMGMIWIMEALSVDKLECLSQSLWKSLLWLMLHHNLPISEGIGQSTFMLIRRSFMLALWP